ncbi:MAG: chemotaxis protein CheA, partial [Calditrichaeota bacterium]
TIRVDVERLDTLMNMMGELVLGRNSMVQTVNNLLTEHENENKYEKLAQSTNSINFITTELQMAVMKMRMQPVGKVFKKFPRLVRDLSRDSKKEIALQITGETTELDKSVIEEIGDPLVHIIRNSCDHGIESPEDRVAKGKSAQGTVKLSAVQEGSNIVIKIEDDGKGLDVDAIRAKAVERKLVSEEDAQNMSNNDVFKFIFEAGFSTAKKITDVSGRGVGMDVVRTNIEKLNGFIELDSELGKGTTISIKLPLTLAIIQGLLVESNDEVFILPLSSVHETVKTEQAEIYYANKKPVLSLREDVIPIVNLNHLLKASTETFTLAQKPYIVIVGLAEKKIGIMIDKFLGQEEVVIKSLGQYLGTTEGVAGATILGDGRIRLIVDLIGLFNIAKRIC